MLLNIDIKLTWNLLPSVLADNRNRISFDLWFPFLVVLSACSLSASTTVITWYHLNQSVGVCYNPERLNFPPAQPFMFWPGMRAIHASVIPLPHVIWQNYKHQTSQVLYHHSLIILQTAHSSLETMISPYNHFKPHKFVPSNF